MDQSDSNGNRIGYVGIAPGPACLLKVVGQGAAVRPGMKMPEDRPVLNARSFGNWVMIFLLPIGGHHLANRSISSDIVLAGFNQVLFADMPAQCDRSLTYDHRLSVFG